MSGERWRVHKFGGSSLADADCFRRVGEILRADAESSARQAVIVSAMRGLTDTLIDLTANAQHSAAGIASGLNEIRRRYHGTVERLLSTRAEDPQSNSLENLLDRFESELAEAAKVLDSVSLLRSASRPASDLVAGLGELWSARLLAAYLQRLWPQQGMQRSVDWVDARKLIIADSGEMGPAVDWKRSRKNAEALLLSNPASTLIVTGFIASDSNGLYTTLGRNGSDLTASIVGALLVADSITIWSDVDGVMSADPRRVPEADVIPELSYNEAMELAYFGAKVLHPQTMSPAIERNIPLRIRNTFRPSAPGTRIGPGDGGSRAVKGITSIDEVALVNLEGAGMIGVPGTAGRLFDALRDARISVILISQASSEHSICFAVPAWHADRVESVVREAFAGELGRGLIQNVEVQPECSIVAVVGDGMAGRPGIAARFFGTLGNSGINVKAIAQGSSERNISAVVEREEVTRSLRAAHSGFTLSTTTLSIALIGPGNVGSVLLQQMSGEIDRLRKDFHLDLRVRALADSRRMLLAERSLDLEKWRTLLDEEGKGVDLESLEAHVNADHLPHAVIIDCTASDRIAGLYRGWLSRGIHIVTPNKRAGSGKLASYLELQKARRKQLSHFLYETTVGAGLPIIETLRDLRQTGDEVIRLEGILSGTLAYLFNVFDGTRPFSQIVREARDNGYTEPDPRDDLSGMDVARKLVILAREMGMQLDLEDIPVESLVPEDLQESSIEEFLEALEQSDREFQRRWRAAHDEEKVIRYVARLESSGVASVKLEALPRDHPFAHLNLTDNIVRFETSRYRSSPLVVQGPGAGTDVTAGGVFADLLRLASYLGAAR